MIHIYKIKKNQNLYVNSSNKLSHIQDEPYCVIGRCATGENPICDRFAKSPHRQKKPRVSQVGITQPRQLSRDSIAYYELIAGRKTSPVIPVFALLLRAALQLKILNNAVNMTYLHTRKIGPLCSGPAKSRRNCNLTDRTKGRLY